MVLAVSKLQPCDQYPNFCDEDAWFSWPALQFVMDFNTNEHVSVLPAVDEDNIRIIPGLT